MGCFDATRSKRVNMLFLGMARHGFLVVVKNIFSRKGSWIHSGCGSRIYIFRCVWTRQAVFWCILTRKTLFLDLVTFPLDLDTFTGPYYNSFGDGYPSFGPAHPPAGPHPSLLLDLALSQTIPLLNRFSSFCPAASASQFFRQ